MEELIKNVILKYTMIKVENSEQNLLDLPVVEECWIYVIMELENTYNLPIIKLLDDIKVDEFNLQTICDKLNHIRKVAFELVYSISGNYNMKYHISVSLGTNEAEILILF